MERITNKLLNFASILDPKTKEQAIESAKMDIIRPYLALMPDAHLGMGATVGSVIPTVGAIMPAAVGVDIGCGMMAVRTSVLADELEDHDLSELHSQISRSIPLSAGKYNQKSTDSSKYFIHQLEGTPGIEQANKITVKNDWRLQLGSLGSGNHFIEVSLDEDNRVWLFLHSGSRGVGNKLAQVHIKESQRLCNEYNIKLPNRDLAYLIEGTSAFDEYMEALNWAQKFALLNRDEMMLRVKNQFERFLATKDIAYDNPIRCHHNYTEKVALSGDGSGTHSDQEVYLSRKGAIAAYEGTWGLIPGSMGDKSYVVVGKGNPHSLFSAPHGAGREYSRSAAKARFNREDLDERMAGIAWGHSDAFLDEHPLAYKNIDVVMEDAAELVSVKHTLRQIVNVKGN